MPLPEILITMAGPTWRNEIDASVGLELSRMSTKAAARRLGVPVLVQIGYTRFALRRTEAARVMVQAEDA